MNSPSKVGPGLSETRSEQDRTPKRRGSSPTSFTTGTHVTETELTEMPFEEEEDPTYKERRELRATVREQARSLGKVGTNTALTKSRKVATGGFSALEALKRKKELKAAEQKELLDKDLLQKLAGEWEITSTSTVGESKIPSVWGRCIVTSLTDAVLVKKSKGDPPVKCTIEGSLESSVTVRWGVHWAVLELSLSNWHTGKLKWRLQPLKNGKLGGMTTWRRKQPPRSLTAQPSSPAKLKRRHNEAFSPQPNRSLTPRRHNEACSPLSPERKRKEAFSPKMSTPKPSPKSFTVFEIASDDEKQRVFDLHASKEAFVQEHKYLKDRIYDCEAGNVLCRSFLLSTTEAASQTGFLGAVTVRINPFVHKAACAWAQIMNVSVSIERQGYGTRLVAGVEELLWREGIEVITLYPVFNNRATSFWTSLGYASQAESFLTKEELGPALLQEGYYEPDGRRIILPRWEKRLFRDYLRPKLSQDVDPAQWRKRIRSILLEDGTECNIDPQDEEAWKKLDRMQWPLWRKVEPEHCKLDSDELDRRFREVQQQKIKRRRDAKEVAAPAADD